MGEGGPAGVAPLRATEKATKGESGPREWWYGLRAHTPEWLRRRRPKEAEPRGSTPGVHRVCTRCVSDEVLECSESGVILSYVTKKMSYLTIFFRKNLVISKKSCTFVPDLKTHNVMTEKTISSYSGYGYRVQLIRRNAVARNWAVVSNRRVVFSSYHETTAKEGFLNHVASIVRQTSIEL